MHANRRMKHRAQSLAFYALFLGVVGLLAVLSTRYTAQWDWTATGSNTLSEPSRQVLDTLDEPLSITSFAREEEMLRGRIEDLIDRYRRHKPDVQFQFVNPDTQPGRVRELGITVDGELLIEYQGRREHQTQLTEQDLTNAIQRVAQQRQRWIVFLSGHGERDPEGNANHDLGAFGEELERKGYTVQSLNLTATPDIPRNTSVLVIASPQRNLLAGEIAQIEAYLDQGGNLLWFTEPEARETTAGLAERLGVSFLPGTVVDASTQLLGIDDPAIALVPSYPEHALTRDLEIISLFPQAVAMEVTAPEGWQANPVLSTLDRTWNETGPIEGTVRADAEQGERGGPLQIGIALQRQLDAEDDTPPREQRALVVGDGDFLSNAYLGNGGNLDLGMRMLRWLASDDDFISIPVRTAPDTQLNLSRTATGVIGIGFLFVLPLLLVGTGVVIWLRRRKR